MENKLDLKGLIPSGNELRVLLNSKHISEGEINNTLKNKGVFCGDGDKTFSVPLLVATLLTPNEYSNIIDKSIARNLKPKSKNFLNRELDFYGEIIIEKQNDGISLESIYTHTSGETELINRRLGVAIAKELKQSGVTKSDVEERITFASFKDIERVRFFKRLTGGLGEYLKLDNVNEIVISREGSKNPLPNDPKVSWMNNTVTSMKIDGNRLHDIFLMSDEIYYEYYYIHNMLVTYKYSEGVKSGTLKICFFFSSSSRKRSSFDKDAELTFVITGSNYDNQPTASIRKNIENDISEKIRTMIKTEYQKILSERS